MSTERTITLDNTPVKSVTVTDGTNTIVIRQLTTGTHQLVINGTVIGDAGSIAPRQALALLSA